MTKKPDTRRQSQDRWLLHLFALVVCGILLSLALKSEGEKRVAGIWGASIGFVALSGLVELVAWYERRIGGKVPIRVVGWSCLALSGFAAVIALNVSSGPQKVSAWAKVVVFLVAGLVVLWNPTGKSKT